MSLIIWQVAIIPVEVILLSVFLVDSFHTILKKEIQ